MKEFNPYLYKAKITKVYDGDTCTAIIDFGFHIQQTMRLRLAEIDAPEIRGKERLPVCFGRCDRRRQCGRLRRSALPRWIHAG